jgi:hypothetical protein
MANNRLTCKHERVEFLIYRIGERRRVYSTCQNCGSEWTVEDAVEDLAEPISSSEVIDVHELLKADKTLGELIPKEKP